MYDLSVDGMNPFPPPQLGIYSTPLATGGPQRSYYTEYHSHNSTGSLDVGYNHPQGTCSLYPLTYPIPT